MFNCGSEFALRFRSGLLLAGSQDASSLRLCSLPRRLSTLVGAEINLNGPAITRSVGKDQGHRGAGVLDCTVATKALPLSMTWPSILVTTSPGVSPAVAAGLPGVSRRSWHPRVATSLFTCAPSHAMPDRWR